MISNLPSGVGYEDCPVATRKTRFSFEPVEEQELARVALDHDQLAEVLLRHLRLQHLVGQHEGCARACGSRARASGTRRARIRRRPGADFFATGFRLRSFSSASTGLRSVCFASAGEEPLELRLRDVDSERHRVVRPHDAHGGLHRLADPGRRPELLDGHELQRPVGRDERDGLVEPLLDDLARLGGREAADEQSADRDTGLDEPRAGRERDVDGRPGRSRHGGRRGGGRRRRRLVRGRDGRECDEKQD